MSDTQAQAGKQQCPYCREWCRHGFCGRCERALEPPQAQAEDRRAQIQARAEKLMLEIDTLVNQTPFADVESTVVERAIVAAFDEICQPLLAELSRLSRVEQALRNMRDSLVLRQVALPAEAMKVLNDNLWELYDDASPEAQPEEGR